MEPDELPEMESELETVVAVADTGEASWFPPELDAAEAESAFVKRWWMA